MWRPCSICQHPQRAVIDDARRNGRHSKRQLAVLYGVSPDAIQRHTLHIAPDTAPAEPPIAPPRDDTAPAAYRVCVVSYPEFEVAVQPDGALGDADGQRQLVREIQSRWKCLDRDHQQEVVEWLRAWFQDVVYEV